MFSISEICDNILYIENDIWQCDFGHGKPIKLGLILEAVDLSESDNNFPYVIDASLIPQLAYMDEDLIAEAAAEGALTQEEKIQYIYESYGGVPINIDALQPPKASCGFSSFVAESSIVLEKRSKDNEIEIRHFQDLEEAMRFAGDFYALYSSHLFSFIDIVLDNPLRAGGTGWDKIKQLGREK